MTKKVQFRTEDVKNAVYVLENFLDGALADYEDGQIKDDMTIEHTIRAIQILEFSMLGTGEGKAYENRYEVAKKKLLKK